MGGVDPSLERGRRRSRHRAETAPDPALSSHVVPPPDQFRDFDEEVEVVDVIPPPENRESDVAQLEAVVAESMEGIQKLRREIWELNCEKRKDRKRKRGDAKKRVKWYPADRSESCSSRIRSSLPTGHPKYCVCRECKPIRSRRR